MKREELSRRTKKKKKRRKVDKSLERLIEDPDTIWVVESLLSKEISGDGIEGYWVRWDGFSEEWDTWEPRSELEKNSAVLVAQFERINEPDLDTSERHCVCQRPYRTEDGAMIQCGYCYRWFHFKCLNITVIRANQFKAFFCSECEYRNPSTKTKYKESLATRFSSFYSDSSTDTLWSPC